MKYSEYGEEYGEYGEEYSKHREEYGEEYGVGYGEEYGYKEYNVANLFNTKRKLHEAQINIKYLWPKKRK